MLCWKGTLGSHAYVDKHLAKPMGATDHVGMVRLGLHAFQFIQDPREASVIMASLLLAAANTDKPIPANVLPTLPADSDPFRYKDPSLE